MAFESLRRLFRGSLPDDSTDQEWVRQTADMGDERVSRYETYENWYDGEHNTRLLERARLFLEGEGICFAENFIDVVVDSLARRLKVETFQVADNDAASEWLNKAMWPANRLDGLQQTIHVETPKLGDGFLIADVRPDGTPRFSWNRPHIVKPAYSDDGDELLYVPKRWPSRAKGPSNPNGKAIWRLNVYFPDRIEKWYSADKDGELWERWLDAADTDEVGERRWPTPWVDGDEPLGIPVFHFRNNPQGRRMGRSEVRGAVPFQRELNKQAIDLFYVMDGQGWKQRWATGIPEDVTLKVAIGEYLKATDPEATFGEFAAENPGPMVEAMEATLRRMSAKTATPLHELISGTPPSGESQKTAEHGNVEKAEDFQTANGYTWADASKLGWRIAAVFSDADVPEYDPDADITAHWEDPATRNERLEAETFEAHHRLGVSKATILRKLGYDPEEEADKRREEGESAGEAVLTAFDRDRGQDE